MKEAKILKLVKIYFNERCTSIEVDETYAPSPFLFVCRSRQLESDALFELAESPVH